MATQIDASSRRPRGRPQKHIDLEELLTVVEQLFADGGFEAVSIEHAAKAMSVSRATLYRTVRSKEELLGLLFARMTEDLTETALEAVKDDGRSADERLHALVRIQIEAAVSMREYMFVFFGGGWLDADVYANWRRWRHEYEDIWVDAIKAAIKHGTLPTEDAHVTTRLMLGMCLWVSRWYRPDLGVDADAIAAEAIRMINTRGT